MSKQSVDELVSSLKDLFQTGAYSDLRIECGDDHHAVHRAVVCPRSPLLRKHLETPNKWADEEVTQDVIILEDDNSEAVRLMLHYLYHLDYPPTEEQIDSEFKLREHAATWPAEAHDVDGMASHHGHGHGHGHNVGESQHGTTNGTNGTGLGIANASPENGNRLYTNVSSATTTPMMTTETAAALAGSSRSSREKRNKHKSCPQPQASTTTQPQQSQPQSSAKGGQPAPTGPLTTHAQMYTLATKYGIPSLAALAASKFSRAVASAAHSPKTWDYDIVDFVAAATEVYRKPSKDKDSKDKDHKDKDRGDDRTKRFVVADSTMRDIVVEAIAARPEMLALADVQDGIRGLELSFDLLMHHLRGTDGGQGVVNGTNGTPG
ncbi:Uu.00g115750.m01.CDS01 [Anthostomella pinea]|uniref:Uu.00g115750.m01.CDS01 n=1 Tax=Anthostomella pinea TaxID=933095 RepID=A0AAI8VGM0_9PEZI|nr:Uu.00g115750.m01.CDS01 [Anthostomella pinea]